MKKTPPFLCVEERTTHSRGVKKKGWAAGDPIQPPPPIYFLHCTVVQCSLQTFLLHTSFGSVTDQILFFFDSALKSYIIVNQISFFSFFLLVNL